LDEHLNIQNCITVGWDEWGRTLSLDECTTTG